MGLCNELELNLRKARGNSEKLMETVVRVSLEGMPPKYNNKVLNLRQK